MIHSTFAHDLKTARRKSGLSQHDCGHLLGIDQRRVSKLETGKTMPMIPEICALSLVYGRTFESLFDSVFTEARTELGASLATLPNQKRGWLLGFNRSSTLNRIADRLEDNRSNHG